MIVVAIASLIVRSDVPGLAVGGLTMVLLCAAQAIEPTARKTHHISITRLVSVVAALLCVVVAGLIVARFAVLGG
jgi:hypothetical protein